MTIKRYNSEKDNTIVNALRENLSFRGTAGNLGASDILEIFSIYGQGSSGSLEQARILAQFPISSISADRDSGIIPASGSVTFKLKMSNTPHGQTAPQNYDLVSHAIVRDWVEGDGLDMESYLDIEASNWLSASDNVTWHNTGSDFASSSYITPSEIPLQYSQNFPAGVENLEIDITGLAEEWIKHHKGTTQSATASITFSENPTAGNTKANGSITVSGNPTNDGTFTLVDTSGSQVFIINTDDNDFDGATDDDDGRTPIGIQAVLGNNNNIADRITTAINGQTTVAITASRSNSVINLTQDNHGLAGNTTISLSNLSNVSKVDFAGAVGSQVISVYSHEGQKFTYTFITSSTYSLNNDVYLKLSGTAAATANTLQSRIDSDFGGKITTNRNSTLLALTQSVGGFHGNTIISSSIASATASIAGFGGGTAMPNYGLIVKLQDDYENGSKKRSYYTKKFYSRSSHEFFLKPQIEAQWDDSIKDDRNYILKSSSLAPAADNLNNIYYYNRIKGNLVDIPSTGSSIIVRFYAAIGDATPKGIVQSAGTAATFVSSSRESAGVYKATFAFSGSQATLYDVWSRSTNGVETELVTGSGFTINTDSVDMTYPVPDFTANITNLKSSYLQGEKATFRVYTRNRNWQPNVYTVAFQTAPVDTIREMFYKVTKVSDNYEIVSYSTGSALNYSGLSYDKDGSYFNLDMSLLEKNNAYQINFVFKDGPNYIELPEKFRFRVDT